MIIPKSQLAAGGVRDGGELELSDRGIRPIATASSHRALDELKLSLALEVVRRFSPAQIRAQILANLRRWKASDAWVPAYDEWRTIAKSREDGALFAAMLGRSDDGVRLRQSMPFVGLLPKAVVHRLNEEAAG